MATNIVIAPTGAVPAYLKKNSSLAEDVATGLPTGMDFPRISIRGSRFRIISDGEEEVLDVLALPVVIVGASKGLTKTYYESKWDPDSDPTPPDCWSMGGVTPDVSITNPVAETCANCPKNVFGSAITDSGRKAKACSDSKRLAVLSSADLTGRAYMLTVTPSALSSLAKYIKALSARGIPVEGVITKVSFDTDASFPKLVFSFGGFLSEEGASTAMKRVGSKDVEDITGATMEAIASASASTIDDAGEPLDEDPKPAKKSAKKPAKKSAKKSAKKPAKKGSAFFGDSDEPELDLQDKTASEEGPEEEEEEEEEDALAEAMRKLLEGDGDA